MYTNKRTTTQIVIPKGLHKEIREKAAREQRQLQEVSAEVIRRGLDAQKRGARK